MSGDQIISARVTSSELDEIDRAAADLRLSRSELVHDAVLKFIASEPLFWEVE